MTTSQTAAEAVLHVSDAPEHLARATGAAKLLRQERPGTRVRIIVNGAALDGIVAGAEPLALDEGYTVEACETGLGRRGMDAAAMCSIVPLRLGRHRSVRAGWDRCVS